MFRLAWVLMLAPWAALAASDQAVPTASEIMARVADNQDRADKLRSEYVYQQHIRIVTRRTNGKLAREETTDYQVIPTTDGTKKDLRHIDGRYWHKGKYLEFHGEPRPEDDSLDGDVIEDLREDLTNEGSKDGLSRDLFPLTSKQQKLYSFDFAGEETFRGRKVYRIRFRPAEKHNIAWAGEAVIDAEEFQPVRVFTRLARRVPLVVRTALGTDLTGIGFNVEYRRFDEGVWFPISFGTEFRLRAVFFLKRDITVSLENAAFERAHVESKILSHEAVP